MEKKFVRGGNPYMPLWEHVPDGEPRVFTWQGETRVYVYGSHDTARTEYCGRDYVVWSAPVTDLTQWTCHGVCYEAEDHSLLYAPDVVRKGDTFYMYAAEQRGSVIRVARAKTPWGPFTDPVRTELGFDPGVLVDDDGKVYAFWGFCASYAAELNEDMATIRPGTLRSHLIGHCDFEARWISREEEHISFEDGFFEASSPRKIFGKYVYLYSKRYDTPVPSLGVTGKNNGFLSYKWSDHPLEGYQPGGDISFNGGEILPDGEGRGKMSYRWGNNHGSVMEINGQWYVFYHRQTGRDEYSRQAMLEPIDAAQGKDGRIYLGKITYDRGEPVGSCPVEMTSQGPQVEGLDAREWISAGYACHLYHPEGTKAYIEPVYDQRDDVSSPIRGIGNGTTVGFRYLRFGRNTPKTVTAVLSVPRKTTVIVRADDYQGKKIARMEAEPGMTKVTVPLSAGIIGRHAIYFDFRTEQGDDGITFDRFTFDD